MQRNESVARMVMLLCFGTAFLSLAVHWRITTGNTFHEGDSTLASQNPQKRGLGQAALGADALPNQGTEASYNEIPRKNPPKKTRQLVQVNSRSLLAQGLVPQKASNNLVNAKIQQVVVDLSDRRVYVLAPDEVVIASYPAAIGKKGWETPTGSFLVMHMQHDPVWRHPITGKVFEPGTDSPLGDRWIGFWSDGRNEIGFHGTPDIDVIGTAISHGCLRMRNSDVKMLYNQVRMGTRVVVRD